MSARTIRISLLDACRFQQQHHYNEANIEAIAADLTEGSRAILNPVHVIPKAGGRWELVAGHDRVEAAKRAGFSDVPARDFDALLRTAEEIYEHWRRDNVLRKQPDREAAAAETLLEWKGKWSDRRVATVCGVSHPTVSKIRARLEEAGQLETVTTRQDTDGKEYKPRTVRSAVPSKRGIPHPTKQVAERKAPEGSDASTSGGSDVATGDGTTIPAPALQETTASEPGEGSTDEDRTVPIGEADAENEESGPESGSVETVGRSRPTINSTVGAPTGSDVPPVSEGTAHSGGEGSPSVVYMVLVQISGLGPIKSLPSPTKADLLALDDGDAEDLLLLSMWLKSAHTRRKNLLAQPEMQGAA